ncbi:hypothetical protein [Roseomonas elaeocarpi]|uniref:DUF4190 domain-containing protein n=1 Tax=Roseomonas elaeocarpi TaxID=907779 RepID=A0ABV6JV77_9PROT
MVSTLSPFVVATLLALWFCAGFLAARARGRPALAMAIGVAVLPPLLLMLLFSRKHPPDREKQDRLLEWAGGVTVAAVLVMLLVDGWNYLDAISPHFPRCDAAPVRAAVVTAFNSTVGSGTSEEIVQLATPGQLRATKVRRWCTAVATLRSGREIRLSIEVWEENNRYLVGVKRS